MMYFTPGRSGLEGDILFLFCSPRFMRARVEAIRACHQQVLDRARSLPASQYSDRQAYDDFQRCCKLARQYQSACPFQTVNALPKLCVDHFRRLITVRPGLNRMA
jgi:hypothetical protein